MDCCTADYRRMFDSRFAERDARRYRANGVRGTSRTLVELAGDVRGRSVLDIGGGIGAIGIELLEAGAERATNVELSSGYEDAATALLAERGLSDRVDRRVTDVVADPGVAGHDVVVMHRVVCCYPDVDALMGAAAGRAQRRLVLTYPQERLWVRAGLAVANAFLRVRGCGFRAYVHPFARIAGGAETAGLRLERRVRHGLVWESAAFSR